jgi:hypothetical protein
MSSDQFIKVKILSPNTKYCFENDKSNGIPKFTQNLLLQIYWRMRGALQYDILIMRLWTMLSVSVLMNSAFSTTKNIMRTARSETYYILEFQTHHSSVILIREGFEIGKSKDLQLGWRGEFNSLSDTLTQCWWGRGFQKIQATLWLGWSRYGLFIDSISNLLLRTSSLYSGSKVK